MISEFNKIKELFKEINDNLESKIEIFIIGGAVLLYHSLKPSTKDIDIVIESKTKFIEFEKALKKAGFKTKETSIEYKNLNLNYIFEKEDFQIDLFHKKVCSKFYLSPHMEKRAEKIINLSNISVFLCSKEDIFLFKTMTDREGDLDDCISLSTSGLNWDTIYNELLFQIKESGKDIWITWVGERLNLLEERGLNIPILSKVNVLAEEYYKKLV